MDCVFAGSASYPCFDEELCAVAAVFGGQKTEHDRLLYSMCKKYISTTYGICCTKCRRRSFSKCEQQRGVKW